MAIAALPALPIIRRRAALSFSNEGTGGSALTWQVYRQPSVGGYYQPVVGDFDGNGYDDIVWYGFGSEPDHLWEYSSFTAVTSSPLAVNGNYLPMAGDFTGDGRRHLLVRVGAESRPPLGARRRRWAHVPGAVGERLLYRMPGS